MRPRVLVDCRGVGTHLDGLGRYTLGLVGALLRQPEEFEIALLASAELPAEDDLARLVHGGEAEVLRSSATFFSPASHLRIPTIVRRFGADLFHHPHFALPLTTPGRIVSTIHDLGPLHEPSYFRKGRTLKRAYFRLAAAYTVRRSTAVITPSEATAMAVRENFGTNVPVTAIAEGADPSFEVPAAEVAAFRERHGLSRPYLLYVGVDRPRKNLPRVIEAFALAAARIPHDLILVGQRLRDTNDLDLLPENLRSRARHLGYLSDAEVRAAYGGADAFLLCSTMEGFGLGVLEAMRAGTAVVTSGTGATAEVAGDAALLVDPSSTTSIRDALVEICLSDERRRDLRERGRRRVAIYTWERAAARTLDVYRRTLE